MDNKHNTQFNDLTNGGESLPIIKGLETLIKGCTGENIKEEFLSHCQMIREGVKTNIAENLHLKNLLLEVSAIAANGEFNLNNDFALKTIRDLIEKETGRGILSIKEEQQKKTANAKAKDKEILRLERIIRDLRDHIQVMQYNGELNRKTAADNPFKDFGGFDGFRQAVDNLNKKIEGSLSIPPFIMGIDRAREVSPVEPDGIKPDAFTLFSFIECKELPEGELFASSGKPLSFCRMTGLGNEPESESIKTLRKQSEREKGIDAKVKSIIVKTFTLS